MALATGSMVRGLVLISLLFMGLAASAQVRIPGLGKKPADQPAPASTSPGDVVATVNGEPITREALAAELIEIHGREHLEQMIDRMLVDQACRSKGVTVTEEDVRQEIETFLKRNNLQMKEFREQVLASQNMTYSQYVRDQVWPKLALLKLVEGAVAVTDEDIQKAFEANFGEKVDVRMLTVIERRKIEDIWKQVDQVEGTEAKVRMFEDLARRYSTDEATRPYGGHAAPIGRHTTHEEIETAAFRLQPGELSSIMQIPGGHMLMICVGRVAAREDVKLDAEIDAKDRGPAVPKECKTYRDVFVKDIEQKKQLAEVAKYFKALQERSKIENMMTGEFAVESVTNPVQTARGARGAGK